MQVEVRDSVIDGAGRGLFALQDFSPGAVVLSLERLCTAELYAERLQDTCAWCFLRGATDSTERSAAAKLYHPTGFIETKACTGCRKVRYCSKTCQSKAWKREHKYECKPLASMTRSDVPHGVRAVFKLLGRYATDHGKNDSQILETLKLRPAGDGRDLNAFREHDPEKFKDFETLAWGACKYAGEPELGHSDPENLAKAFFFNVMCNCVSLTAPYNDDSLGVGFDPLLCSANHSCDPNVASVFNQPKFLLRALKPIKKGDELTLRYIDISNPFSVRRADLQDRYRFTCECSTCAKGPTLPPDTFLRATDKLSPTYISTTENLMKRHLQTLDTYHAPARDELSYRRLAAIQAEGFSVSGISGDNANVNRNASEGDIKDALKLCLNSGMWSFTRQPVPHLLRQLYVYYVESKQRYPAWRVGLKMYFETLPSLYPVHFHPDRVVDVWSLATTTNFLCYPEEKELREECMRGGLDLMVVFAGLLFDVHDNMPQSYGLESPFGKIVDTVFQQTVKAAAPLTERNIREMIKETWVKLEAVARSVDVLTL